MANSPDLRAYASIPISPRFPIHRMKKTLPAMRKSRPHAIPAKAGETGAVVLIVLPQ